jgi:hypothetical protein
MALTKIPTHMLFSGAASEDLSIDSDTLFIDSSANRVGIANNSPSVALDVTGALTVSGAITGTLATAAQTNITSVGTLTALTGGTGDLIWDTNTLFVDSSANKIYIGDTASHTDDFLQIETPASGGGHGIQLRRNDSNTDQQVGRILFGNNTDTDLVQIHAKTDGANDNGALIFSTQPDGGSLTERMRINHDGMVLIGTDSGDSFNADSMLRLQRAGDRVFMQFKTDADQNSGILFGDVDDDVECAIEYEPANKALTFSTGNNAEALRIDTNGNVGIGTTSPTSKLTVTEAGDGNTPTMHIIDSTDTEVAWFEGNRAGDTGAFINVRHNPSTPQETNRSGIRFQADDDGGNVTNYARITQYIEDHTNTAEDGRLAINVMSDGSDNEVVNIRKDQFIYTGDAGSSFIRVDNRADGHDTGFEIYQNNSRMWEIHSDDSRTNALQIRPSGNSYYEFSQSGVFRVGLGNVADATVVIDSASGGDPTLIFDTGAANRSGLIKFKDEGTVVGRIEYVHQNDQIRMQGGSSTGTAFMVGNNRTGFNTTSARSDMACTSGSNGGTTSQWGFGGGTSNTIFYVINEDNDGVQLSHGGTSWQAHSDERIKENITSLGTVLPDLVNMRCVKYNRKGKSDTKIGFIAQDWESKFSEVVHEDDGFMVDNGSIVGKAETESTDKVKTIAYTETIPILLKAIQELEARIATLESS